MNQVLTDDRHPLADVVEVEDGQELVDHFPSHLHNRDGLGGPIAEDEAEVTGCDDQSALVWRLSLIVELPCGDGALAPLAPPGRAKERKVVAG